MLEWLFSRVAQSLLQVGTGYAASILIRNDLDVWLLVPAVIVILLNVLVTLPWWMKPAVAGRAYRTRLLCYVPVTDDWHVQLMTELGFTANELSRYRTDRNSYLCVPILGEHAKVVAILSFDSKYPDTFNSDRIAWIEYMAPYFSTAIGGE